jgi:hypothetical protein
MSRGGARNRSGPQKDPMSARSARAGFTLTALPQVYDGPVPPLEPYLPGASDRHKRVWFQLWTTPQANAWSRESWRWPIVADLVRYTVLGESDDAPVSVATAKRQLRDDLGLSAAGLKANGWAIAVDELAAWRDSAVDDEIEDDDDPRNRLTVADGGA